MKLFRRRRPARAAATGYSVIDDELTISGDINTEGTIRVDGRVEGSMHRAGTLIIGAGGTVIGNVDAQEVVIGGELCGSVTASERIEVQPKASVQGDIRAAAVLLAEGATVHGHVSVHPIGSDMSSISTERRLQLTPSRAMQAVAQG